MLDRSRDREFIGIKRNIKVYEPIYRRKVLTVERWSGIATRRTSKQIQHSTFRRASPVTEHE